MNNKTELFIKHLDENLSENERKEFEKELMINQKFKTDFEIFSKRFDSLKNEIEVDEDYFVNLIPKVRERNRKDSYFNFGKLAYVLPVIFLTAFLIIKYIPFVSEQKYDSDSQKFYALLTENEDAAEEFLTNVFDNSNYYNNNYELLFEDYKNDVELDETVYDYLEQNITPTEITKNIYNELTENEFNQVYNKILNKKIL